MKIKNIKHIVSDKEENFYDVINCYPFNNFLVSVGNTNIVAHNCAFMD